MAKTSGSALLLVLWAVIIISGVVLGLVTLLQANQEESTSIQHAFLARQVAESALAIASNPEIGDDDPLLNGTAELAGHYKVVTSGEGGRLNINQVLKKGHTEILTRLFADCGLNPAETSTLVESLRRWTQPASGQIFDSEDASYYEKTIGPGGTPPHRPFFTVDEMAGVRGMEALIAKKPDWRKLFTVWTAGKLDLNDASADLIAAVIGDQRAQIAALIQQREKMRSSRVDAERRWQNLEQPLAILGVRDDSASAAFFTVGSLVERIDVTATVGTRTSRVGAIVNKGRTPSQTFFHYEL